MKLADVIDLELQLSADEALDDATLRARDRPLFRALSPAPADDAQAISAWLSALRDAGLGARFSEPILRGHRLLRLALVGVGLLSGWGTAAALLHYEEGGSPVNVGAFLAVVTLGQLGLLGLLLLLLAARTLFPERVGLGEVGRLLRYLSERIATLLSPAVAAGAREEREALFVLYRRVRSRFGLYKPLEQALILGESQLFGIAFNVGLLLSCVRLVLLSDLAFGWSTSVAALDPPAVHTWLSRMALPFAFLGDGVVPSLELVERTQYFRLDGRFAGAGVGSRGDAQLAGSWWSFLLASTITYGLLPRLVAYILARVALHRAEARVPLDTPAVTRLLRRLRMPELSTRARQIPADRAPEKRPPLSATGDAGEDCVLVVYRDVPTDAARLSLAVSKALGLAVRQVRDAGGFDAAAEAELLALLRDAPSQVVLVAEAWEAPDKGLRTLLAKLRSAMGPRRSLWVALLGEASAEGFTAARPDDVTLFRDRLTLLEDPYLRVDALPAPSPEVAHGV